MLDFHLSECLEPGIEDFKEGLIQIDFVEQTKLWVMVLNWDACIENAKLCLCVVIIFCFSVQHFFSFFFQTQSMSLEAEGPAC